MIKTVFVVIGVNQTLIDFDFVKLFCEINHRFVKIIKNKETIMNQILLDIITFCDNTASNA